MLTTETYSRSFWNSMRSKNTDGSVLKEGANLANGSYFLPEASAEKYVAAYISKILREDGIVRLEITVESSEIVKRYIGELEEAGFSFDTKPDAESDHMEFLAFKDNGMISFAYKGEENAVSIEYQK